MTIEVNAPDQYGVELPDREVAIAANSEKLYGPYSPEGHNERSGTDEGFTSIEFSNVTGVEVTVIRPGEKVR